MSPQEYGQVLWRELQGRLRAAIQPRLPGRAIHFDVEDVLQLCYRQLQREEFAEPGLEQAATELPEEPQSLQDCIAEVADALAGRVGAEQYVEDCVQVARFVAAERRAERETVAHQYWLDYSDWTYGEDQQDAPPKKKWGGVLGARLTAYLGRREAESEFAGAKDELDARVFTVDKFGECVRVYRPGLGMKFENFFKQRIRRGAGDVARNIARKQLLGDSEEVEEVLEPSETAGPCEASPLVSQASYRECLGAFRRTHDNGQLAARKIAAFELYYKAYLDPRSEITRETLDLVSPRGSRMQNEFDACQCQLRDLEEELNAAESASDSAWKAWQSARRALAAERCSPGEMVRLESEVRRGNKGELEKALVALGPAGRNSHQGQRIQYRICYQTLARTRGKRERCWKQWEQWEQCRLPWVRSHQAIVQLLAQGSQPTVSRHLAEVKQAMRVCLGLAECSDLKSFSPLGVPSQ